AGRARVEDADPMCTITGDHVPSSWRRTADRVVRSLDHVYPGGVPKRMGAGRVRTDVVALDEIACRPDRDPALQTAGDDIACTGRGTADHVVRRGLDEDACIGVRDRDGTGDVGADEVAQDLVPRGVGAPHVHAESAVAG